MGWEERITVNSAVRSGKPCIKGTRIAVYDVLEYLAGGMTEEQILSDFPDLTREREDSLRRESESGADHGAAC